MHETGRHELEYSLDCERSPGQARFGLIAGDDGASLVAFVITPAAGSTGQAAMLERTGGDMLSGLIGQPVVRLEAPLDQLLEVGDHVEGTVVLEDGSELQIRAVQNGRRDDFDAIDFGFQVLDVPWLLRRMFEQRSQTVESVECPQRVPKDGAVMTCGAITGDGKLAITLQRTGGDYQVVEAKRVGGE
jgi:hypothetical protein